MGAQAIFAPPQHTSMRKLFSLLLLAGFLTQALAQTSPDARLLPYEQTFDGLATTSTAYPLGWQGWTTIVGYAGPAILTGLLLWPVSDYVLLRAYRQEQKHKVARRRVKLQEEEALVELKTTVAKVEKRAIEAQVDVRVPHPDVIDGSADLVDVCTGINK